MQHRSTDSRSIGGDSRQPGACSRRTFPWTVRALTFGVLLVLNGCARYHLKYEAIAPGAELSPLPVNLLVVNFKDKRVARKADQYLLDRPAEAVARFLARDLRDAGVVSRVQYEDLDYLDSPEATATAASGKGVDLVLTGRLLQFAKYDNIYWWNFCPPYGFISVWSLLGLPTGCGSSKHHVAFELSLREGSTGREVWQRTFENTTEWEFGFGTLYDIAPGYAEDLGAELCSVISRVRGPLRQYLQQGQWRTPAGTPSPRPVVSRPQPAPPPPDGRYTSTRTRAVVVGISNYSPRSAHRIPRLRFASADAESVCESLTRQGWRADSIKRLVNEQATKSEVENWIRYGPDLDDSLFVLYWAGHGYPDPADARKLFLACYDTDLSKPGTGLRMNDVRRWLEERKARNVVILADACHAGGLISSRSADQSSSRGLTISLKSLDVPAGWIYLLGSRTTDKAVEHPMLQGGLFTRSLVEGLDGKADGYGMVGKRDGVVTLGEVREFVRDRVKDYASELNLSGAFEIEGQTNTADKGIWTLSLKVE